MWLPCHWPLNEGGMSWPRAAALAVAIGVRGAIVKSWVVRPLGAGLDERALAAVRAWRFTPARDAEGVPVPHRLRQA